MMGPMLIALVWVAPGLLTVMTVMLLIVCYSPSVVPFVFSQLFDVTCRGFILFYTLVLWLVGQEGANYVLLVLICRFYEQEISLRWER